MQSAVWKDFNWLYFSDSQKYADYVICKTCECSIKYDRAKSGTSHLAKRVAKCKNKPSCSATENLARTKLSQFLKKKDST